MSKPALSSETPTCPKCGWGVDDEILADTPDCPHGWVSLEGMAMADIKALFAESEDCDCEGPHLSLDPVAAPVSPDQEGSTE